MGTDMSKDALTLLEMLLDKNEYCIHCGRVIYLDLDGGYWIHREILDGKNGLYCSPGMWGGTETKKYAVPAKPEIGEKLRTFLSYLDIYEETLQEIADLKNFEKYGYQSLEGAVRLARKALDEPISPLR